MCLSLHIACVGMWLWQFHLPTCFAGCHIFQNLSAMQKSTDVLGFSVLYDNQVAVSKRSLSSSSTKSCRLCASRQRWKTLTTLALSVLVHPLVFHSQTRTIHARTTPCNSARYIVCLPATLACVTRIEEAGKVPVCLHEMTCCFLSPSVRYVSKTIAKAPCLQVSGCGNCKGPSV